MQFPISDRAAVKFTGEFYGALVDGLPVDQAVSSARKSLLDGFADEWATPVLFLRSPDGNIFENVHAQAPGLHDTPPTDESRDNTPVEEAGQGLDDHTGQPPDDQADRPDVRRAAPDQEAVGWVRDHVAVIAVVLGVLLILVAAFLVIPRLGDDGSEANGALGGDAAKDLPTGTALTEAQLLVAAGADKDDLHIFLFDTTTGREGAQALTRGTSAKEWLPVLSPDRKTMIYSREREFGFQLRTAAAIDGSSDRPLFDESSLSQCSGSTGRPAWIPGTEDLVMRCFGDGAIRLVRVDVHGSFVRTYDKIGSSGTRRQLGDPTVSPNGATAVYFASQVPKSRDGALVQVNLETGEPDDLLDPTDEFSAYSDAVFSPVSNMLAWRATAVTPQGTDPSEGAGFEVLAAPFVDGALDLTKLVRISGGAVGDDQDPMFSPDGKQIIYSHSPPDDPNTTVGEPDVVRELWIASVTNPEDRRKLSGDAHAFYAVPAWSRR
jgi:hypothetical protein